MTLHDFLVAKVDRVLSHCVGEHRFESCRGLRFFLCPTLVTCWLIHFHIDRFSRQNNNFASHFFCTFLCCFCTTTMWNCLILLFREDINKRWQNFILFWNLNVVLRNSAPGRVHLHLTKQVSWNNRDKVWKNANSFWKRHFHCRCIIGS